MRRTLFEAEHIDYRESVRRFVAEEITANHAEWERDGIVPRELFVKAAAKGMLAMQVPERFGGAGTDDFRFNQIVAEEVSLAGDAGSGLGITLHNDICLPYFTHFCNEEQRERWMPGIADGNLITAVAMTEPEMGSDLAGLRTTAVRDGDEYVVNGSKTFITNGINSDLVITAVKTDPSQRHGGISLLIIERGMEGFERGRNLEKVGMHAQDTAELFFNDVRVPVENLLGEEGQGFRHMTSNLPQERLSIAIAGVAAARGRSTRRSPTSRSAQAFGQPIGSFQNTASRSPRWRPRSRSRPRSATRRCWRSTPASCLPRTRRWPSGGRQSSRAGLSTAASSSTAATATCSSTRSRVRSSTPG